MGVPQRLLSGLIRYHRSARLAWPQWDALVDSMIWGGINTVEPPYTVLIRNTGNDANEARNAVDEAQRQLALGRQDLRVQEQQDIDVSIEMRGWCSLVDGSASYEVARRRTIEDALRETDFSAALHQAVGAPAWHSITPP